MASINELQLAKELIKFPTVTPIDAGIMKLLEKKLKTLGFKTKILEFKEKNSKPVKNLYARLGNKGPNFCYAGHLDVVPAGNLKDWTVNPFKPSIKKGYLIGRGANDMKSSIAAFVSAADSRSRLRNSICSARAAISAGDLGSFFGVIGLTPNPTRRLAVPGVTGDVIKSISAVLEILR